MLKRTTEIVLLLLLVAAILFLGITGELKLLINPKYFTLIFISMFILVFFAVLLLFIPGKPNIKVESKFVLFAVTIGLLFSTSYSNFQDTISDKREIDLSQHELSNGIPQITADANIIRIYSENFLDIANQLYSNPDKYRDIEVNIDGFIHFDEFLGDDHFVISRLIMMCCAADTTIYGLLAEKSNLNFEEDEWYNLTGTISYKEFDLHGEMRLHPVIKITNYIKIDPLEDPYIYLDY